MIKSGRRREVPMNRMFKTRYIKTAYNNAVEPPSLTTSPSTPGDVPAAVEFEN
jgi:hypothetical protein